MQPPLRGCVLKLIFAKGLFYRQMQPPLRGCVLKPILKKWKNMMVMQPPLRGCVLKLLNFLMYLIAKKAAASARLCVETIICNIHKI